MSGVQKVSPQKVSPLYNLAARYSIEPNKLLDVLRGTVIKPDKTGRQATNEELAAFCIVADQYGLNPFIREIYAFPSAEKGLVPIVGVDGWVNIVNRTGQFDGCEFSEVGDEEGRPVQITCTMHVKGRAHPVAVTERYSECVRDTKPWKQMPWRVLRHKTYIQAARYAFGISGIYDEDEGQDILANSPPLREPVPMPRALSEREPGIEPRDPDPVACGHGARTSGAGIEPRDPDPVDDLADYLLGPRR